MKSLILFFALFVAVTPYSLTDLIGKVLLEKAFSQTEAPVPENSTKSSTTEAPFTLDFPHFTTRSPNNATFPEYTQSNTRDPNEEPFPPYKSTIITPDEWESWKTKHGKTYVSRAEEASRKRIYAKNKYKIQHHNKRAARGEFTYFLEVNRLADMSEHEINSKYNGYKPEMKNSSQLGLSTYEFIPPVNVQYPYSIDWRKLGAVTPVKNQGECGSCWTFSATGALEGQLFRKTGKLVSLSEENILDCDTTWADSGCDGGYPELAFRYVQKNHGLDTEVSYPYLAKQHDSCLYNPANKAVDVFGVEEIKYESEEELLKAVATKGPVSVSIDASNYNFHFYKSGVYYEENCSDFNLDHAVLVVGYGTENGYPYWLVKNSWDSDWGEEGYIKMARFHGNNCGIASSAVLPIV